jgi:cell division protease FtsH
MTIDAPPPGGPGRPPGNGTTEVDPNWPPPEGLPSPGKHAPEPEEKTRKPLPLWDRLKFLLLLGVAWLILLWASMAGNPILPFTDAVRLQVRSGWWLLALMGLEVIRQLHFLISEHWARYHRFWTKTLLGRFDRAIRRKFSDWTRFRIARVLKILFVVALYAVIAGKILDTSPALAIFEAPAILLQVLPFVFQLAFGFFFIALQFIGLFWLLSRGGVDVYYPDDITTRFSDVWGQDHVLARVKENILFLETPDEIEERVATFRAGSCCGGPREQVRR